MPNYTFVVDGKKKTEFMSIAEFEKLMKAKPGLQQVFSGAYPVLDSHRLGRIKPDQGFRDILRSIKSKHRKSTINV